ncbi:hypothetical protein [Streptomyces mayteni]
MTAPAHFHAYHWQGERRVYDQEADRRPGPFGPSPGFLANICTPIRISDWLLRPSSAIAHTCRTSEDAADWFRRELGRAAPAFAVEHDREQAATRAERAAERLGWGGDVHAGWYLRGTGYLTLDVVGCSPNHSDPRLPCPLRAPGPVGAGVRA